MNPHLEAVFLGIIAMAALWWMVRPLVSNYIACLRWERRRQTIIKNDYFHPEFNPLGGRQAQQSGRGSGDNN